MSYDISYHPVDGAFIRDRVIPYVRGTGALDDVLPDMVRIERTRRRAREWARKVEDLYFKEAQRGREAREAAARNKNRGDPTEAAPTKRSPADLVPEWFSSELHGSGRPFFITAPTPEEVSDCIDRYCAAATTEEVDALVREELERLNPKLVARIKPPREKALPDDKAIAAGLVRDLDLARSWLELKDAGQPFVDEDGEERDAAYMFAHSFPLMAVAFAAVLRPGWATGGRVWPTFMMNEAGFSPDDYFEKPTPLFASLRRTVPQLEGALKTTIVLNYELGGYVRPARVRALRRHLAEIGEEIVEVLEYGTEDLRMIDEALYDAARRKLGFVEVAEVFGGITHILN